MTPVYTIIGANCDSLEADAHLIAAAPDLLAALEAVTACLRGFHAADDFGPLDDEAIDAALDAINKAKAIVSFANRGEK